METAPHPTTAELSKYSLDPVRWTEQTRILRGRPFSFEHRPYLHQIMRDTSPEVYIVKGRQTELSEMLVNQMMCNASKHPNTTSLYMSATQEFTYVFSNTRFRDQALEPSPAWHEMMPLRDHMTRQAILRNGSLLYFRGAFAQYKEARSLPVDFLYLDEMQSHDVQYIDVATAAMLHSPHKKIIGVGTGDYEDTGWYKRWHMGVQHEWDAEAAAWIPTNTDGDPTIHSYHIPLAIVPWITDADLEKRINNAMSRNLVTMEIHGWWVQGVKKPITTSMIEALFMPSLSMTRPEDMRSHHNQGPIFVGIDFGGGTKAHTVFWCTQLIDADLPIFRLRYACLIDDKDVEVQADKIIKLIQLCDPDIGVMDQGGGARQMQKIEDRFIGQIHKCHYTYDEKKPLNLDDLYKYNLIHAHRTHATDGVIDLFSRKHVRPGVKPAPLYQIPYSEPGAIDWATPHLTSIYARNVTSSTGHSYIKYDKEPTDVDDALHAATYGHLAYLIWKKRNQSADLHVGSFDSI